jgi:hypothetical protein
MMIRIRIKIKVKKSGIRIEEKRRIPHPHLNEKWGATEACKEAMDGEAYSWSVQDQVEVSRAARRICRSVPTVPDSSVADPGCLSRIPDPDFYPSRIPDPGSRIPDPKTATKKAKKNLMFNLFM